MDINHLDVKWQLTGDVGVLTDNTLKATKAGKGKIMVTVNHITKELPITVLGEKDIKEFKLLAKDPSFDPQKPVSLVVSLITKDGKERDVPSSMAQWNLTGFKGSISPQGILTIEEWTKGGYISAIFNGLKATLNLEEDLIDKTAPWSKIGTVTVTGATVNIRSGPDTTHPVLTQVFRGVPLKVLGQQGDLLEVSLPNGTVGWIANWLVDYSPVPAVIIGNVVNIRKGPSVDQEVITQLKKGELVTVITKEKDWLKVVLPDDLTGWVADWLVEPKAAEE